MKLLPITVVLALCLGTLVSTAASFAPLARCRPAVVANGRVSPVNRLAGTNRLHLAISLPLRNQDALTNLIREISDPASANFHHYLTPGQFAEQFGPSESDYETLKAFARSNGLTIATEHPNRLILDVHGAAADIEKALHVTMRVYSHPTEKRTFYAPDVEPTLDLPVPVLHISGLDDYSQPRTSLKKSPPGPAGVTPDDGSGTNGTYYSGRFRAVYAPDTTLQGTGQSVGLVQFDGYAASDITNFVYQNFYPAAGVPLTNVLVDNFDGSTNGAEDEVCLDIEMAMSMAPGLASIIVYEGGPLGNFPDILNRMATDNLASQLSCSWYMPGLPADPACEAIFLEMAAQGQSFLTASGDSDADTGLINFPEDNPYITSVGGTSLFVTTVGGYDYETVWNWNDGRGSSGGISTQYPIPTWQAGINMSACQGSTTMRNVPDVALTADNIAVWTDGGISVRAGTSCAAPLWAGFIALVNEQAAQSGQPPVGFLNPALYAIAASGNSNAFHDIVYGDNTSPGSPNLFPAVPGYDLCTGLGTPNGSALINALATPAFLGVSPQFVSAGGLVGGPFSPASWVVTLTNRGSSNLNWTITGLPAWLAVSGTNGTLPASGWTNLTLSLQGAEALPYGIHNAQLLVGDPDAFAAQSLAVNLTINQSIVQNGGFETGNFTGWTLVGDTVDTENIDNSAENSTYPGVVHSGIYGALLGQFGYLATLTQVLPTVANQKYLLSFWLENYVSGGTQLFRADWNGTNVMSLFDPPVLTWTNCQFIVTASGASTTLQFGTQNNAFYFGLDDINVFPLPPVEFTQVSVAGTDLQLGWNALAGLTYQVQYSPFLPATSWQNLATIIASTNTASFTDTNVIAANGQRYYRLALAP